MRLSKVPAEGPLPFVHPVRRPWRLVAGITGGVAVVTWAWALYPRGDREAAPTKTEVVVVSAASETEQIHDSDVTAMQPTIKDAEISDHNETDNDLATEESLGEGGVSDAPFEGPKNNGLIGIGGGAGGAFSCRGGARRIVVGGRHGFPCGSVDLSEGQGLGTESYTDVGEDGFLRVASRPLSTFSIDVDSASYANVRRMLVEGHLPPKAAVRVEELVNYFPYAYAAPTDGRPFAVHGEIAGCPWDAKHRLVRIGLKARDLDRKQRPASNIVFLLDVSGSMNSPNKLPLVKASMRMLLDEMTEKDYVSIVTYAGESGLALPPTTCEKKAVIADAIDRLAAGGSTNGASGITLAYQIATERFIAGGVNRVVLCTDGDWNVGVTGPDDLWKMIVEKAKSGVFLSVLGFGMGNYKDAMLEQLADKGNGNYGYIDSTREAHKVLVEEAGGTLVTVAKDVKIQVEWNPATVAGYRLVGYENRKLADKDFKDDTKDAGEIGAGHTVTAIYEVVPAGGSVPDGSASGDVDPLKYQKPISVPTAPTGSGEMLTVKLRYKEPAAATSTGFEAAFTDAGVPYGKASAEFKFAASVAAFALLLRESPQKGTASYGGVLELAGEAVGNDPGGYRAEFLDLVAKARALTQP